MPTNSDVVNMRVHHMARCTVPPNVDGVGGVTFMVGAPRIALDKAGNHDQVGTGRSTVCKSWLYYRTISHQTNNLDTPTMDYTTLAQ
eukprot:m.134695 g.134695  ORF g.134695 m.134695 type:complete len:87 (+) comp11396_c1_seq3:1598-1858(+)